MQATDKTTMPRYPEVGEVPEHQHLTVCEVITWIGYGRAIPKEVYFAPFVEASGITHDKKVALLHQSVPAPKPLECPMDDAERTLMDLVRNKRLSLLIEQNGRLVDAPAEIYEYAVTANARGSIEADWTATERDRERARAYLDSRPPIGTVLLRKSQVLDVLPQPAPAATPPAGTPTKPELEQPPEGASAALPEPETAELEPQQVPAVRPEWELKLFPEAEAPEFINLNYKPPTLPRHYGSNASLEQMDECIKKLAAPAGGYLPRSLLRTHGRYWLRHYRQTDTPADALEKRFGDEKHQRLHGPRGKSRLAN